MRGFEGVAPIWDLTFFSENLTVVTFCSSQIFTRDSEYDISGSLDRKAVTSFLFERDVALTCYHKIIIFVIHFKVIFS